MMTLRHKDPALRHNDPNLRHNDTSLRHNDPDLRHNRTYPPVLLQADAWFRADSGITLNGSTVSSWADRNGNVTATQSTEANQPIYTASAVGGRPALQTDGNDGLTVPAMNHGTSAITVLFAVHLVPDSSLQYLLFQGSSASSTQYRIPNASNQAQWVIAGTSVVHSQVLTESDYVMVLRFDGSAAEAQRVRMSINGSSNTLSISSTALGAIDGVFEIFRGSFGPASGTQIAELAIIDEAVTDSEFTTIENYALARYGL